MQETRIQSLGQEDPLEEEMTTHSSILAWRILWTEDPGGLQSKGWRRVRHTWGTNNIEMLSSRHILIPWKMIVAFFPLLEVAKLEPIV